MEQKSKCFFIATKNSTIRAYSAQILFNGLLYIFPGFPGDSVVKNLTVNARGTDSIPGSGRCPGEGNDNTLQYPCLENSMDRGGWWAI